ncbi:THAP domain-containing protein 3 isoform X1 [Monomorium pharaonis]|uniref:THAP domain-containing protein 3 isoform X1 n=1 Tax=Monomorium pharaonis TaxID=307658 RepID=UPI00063F248A|nr:THAP domain-containing protein 3 isoform X1 [Monomorium pharaonis]
MGRRCYLCNKCNKSTEIALHRFPQNTPKYTHVYQRWLQACGLNERDDVSHIYICTNHFTPEDFHIKNKRIRLNSGAIPSITVPNPTIKETNNITDNRMIIQSTSDNNNTADFEKKQLGTPQKPRRFAELRYISKIKLADVATPRKAKKTLLFVKFTDKKKSKKIKLLQDANKKLKQRIISMRLIMSQLLQKGLILKDAEDILLVQ